MVSFKMEFFRVLIAKNNFHSNMLNEFLKRVQYIDKHFVGSYYTVF